MNVQETPVRMVEPAWMESMSTAALVILDTLDLTVKQVYLLKCLCNQSAFDIT